MYGCTYDVHGSCSLGGKIPPEAAACGHGTVSLRNHRWQAGGSAREVLGKS
jgi:hypothetical protein